jgi:signal peptidase I
MRRALAVAALLLLVAAKKTNSDGLRIYNFTGDAMEPTIHTKERVLVDELAYMVQRPQRGHVVAYRYPTDTAISTIKRIVGMPGETVELRKGKLFINAQEMAETWVHTDANAAEKPSEDYGPLKLGPAEYFLLSDNRSRSYDSRAQGAVMLGFIHGRVLRAAGQGGVRDVR